MSLDAKIVLNALSKARIIYPPSTRVNAETNIEK
jgi:hypothetical protein